MFEIYEGDIAEMIGEKMIVRVNSKGKKTKRKKCNPGYKLQGNKCVKISAREKLNRTKGAKRSQIKRRSSKTSTNRKRLKATKHRQRLGL